MVFSGHRILGIEEQSEARMWVSRVCSCWREDVWGGKLEPTGTGGIIKGRVQDQDRVLEALQLREGTEASQEVLRGKEPHLPMQETVRDAD